MTKEEIRSLIAGTPAAMALVDAVRNDPSPAPDSVAIAAAINVGRTRFVERNIGDGDVSLALGTPDGPLFLMQLEDIAENRPESGADEQQLAVYATARQAWRSLGKGQFQIGNPSVRDAIDMFVGVLLTAEQAVSIKALAPEVPDPISEFDVRCAILGDDGSLLV